MSDSPHSMYDNEHAEYLFAKVLAPHVCRLPVEQDRLDACHHLARLVEQHAVQARALRAIHFNASSWHGDDAAKGRALNVISAWALHPESVPKGIGE